MAKHIVEVTPDVLAQWDRMVQDKITGPADRQYVVVEGGLVQYGSDSVDVIDLDFIDQGSFSEAEIEEAMHALALMNLHKFRVGSNDRERLVAFIRNGAEQGVEAHHPDCDRLLSWESDQAARTYGIEEDRPDHIYSCNLGCNESLEDVSADLEQYRIVLVED